MKKNIIACLILALSIAPAFARGGGGHGFSHSSGHTAGWMKGFNHGSTLKEPVGFKAGGASRVNVGQTPTIYGRIVKDDTWNNSVHQVAPNKHMGVVLKSGHYVFTNE